MIRSFMPALATLAVLAAGAACAEAQRPLPTGQTVTPLAAKAAVFSPLRTGIGPHSDYVADGAAAMRISPDGRHMLILTSGYNRYNGPDGELLKDQSGQYIFVYDLTVKGAVHRQTLEIPNAFYGVAWRPDSLGFYISGGVDDAVYRFVRGKRGYHQTGKPIALGHSAGNGIDVKPQSAGVAVSPDGRHLLVANYYNDSVSLIDLATAKVTEQDLRPGKIDPGQRGVAGGEYPFDVVWRDARHAYVSAARDREIIALDIDGGAIRVTRRLAVAGEPTTLLIDPVRHRLYATEDNADKLAVIDTSDDRLLQEAAMGFPEQMPEQMPEQVAAGDLGKGVNPNALALLPDGQLLVTFGGINAVAMVDTSGASARVEGLIPTGWYPSAVATRRGRLFVANRKSPPGPNPQGCQPKVAVERAQPTACGASNQYIFQLEKAGLLQAPLPRPAELANLTLKVAENTGLDKHAERARGDAVMAQIHQRIWHVVFIIKENRTYDQVLGDLETGNGDPRLAILGERLTPNHHALARQFVNFDNFMDSGEQSSTGWSWSTAARTTDILEKTAPVNYAGRGLAYESEGTSRNLNTSLPAKARHAANPKASDDDDLLPGPLAITSPDAKDDDLPGQGFLWNAALRAGLSLRNYGFANDMPYDADEPGAAPLARHAFADKATVFTADDRALAGLSDPYYRGFDQKFPDYWNVQEWMREFAEQEADQSVPALTLLRISHDHFGDFDTAIDGVNTVETEMADNDYALGLVIERIAHSTVKDSTLVFVIEDDAQNGADHVSARRSIAYIVGPYVRQHALVSAPYTTINMLRTIEGVLGLKPMGLNDALAVPMADAFDLRQKDWTYTAHASLVLKSTALPIPPQAFVAATVAQTCPLRTAAYWAQAMKGQNFEVEDHLDTTAFNAALWTGLAGATETPARDGKDLSQARTVLLQRPEMQPPCPSGSL
ncbi:YncE family protein [Asticcacaulis sp. 201]|uniref:YncE family protein n=1 Tax=Asticcacaulis sp. 201 TaxID=3028787 RepID=UPI0029160690|nr:YncE family protein [Asticcacaulis sp. 201]MDV6329954.1 YncE family protein [Asticcacaulis sp. 201]